MSVKRRLIGIADKFTNRIDNKMKDYVSKFVNDSASDLEKAISIYLCLGDVLCYNPLFILTYDYDSTQMVRNINPENNEMVCKS